MVEECPAQMNADAANASYAIFWSNANGKLVVSGDYVTDAERVRMKELGLVGSYAEKSESYVLDSMPTTII